MNYLDLINDIFKVCIVPLLGVLTTYIVKYIENKNCELQTKTDNEKQKKYLDLVTDTVEKCVVATNQTYVDSLKNKDAFDIESQKKAFEDTYNNVMSILNEDVKKYLNTILGDLNLYVTNLIESEVNINKSAN